MVFVKAQISEEFIIYVGVLVLIMAFAAYFAIVTAKDIRTEGINTDAKLITASVATEINTAFEVGDGYSRKFFLPHFLHFILRALTLSGAARIFALHFMQTNMFLNILFAIASGNFFAINIYFYHTEQVLNMN